MKKQKKIDPYNAEHPARKAAIRIIESVIEPFIKRGLQGKAYYALEDELTAIILNPNDPYNTL